MTVNNNQEIFPIAIFLDTNILDSLPENLVSGDLSGLIADAKNIGSDVYIPDVVAREWLTHRIDKFFNSLEEYLKSGSHIKKYFSEIPEFKITKSGFLSNVYRFLISHLKNSGCRLLCPPKTTIRRLTTQAVQSIPPFRNSNKGFKDELIILSMLKLPQRNWNYKTYVLVTKDNVFSAEELKKRFAHFDVRFERVNSLQDARKLLDQKLDATWKHRREALEAEVKGFLSPHWDAISQAVVRQVEDKGVSIMMIYGYKTDDIPENSYIKRIIEVIPVEIEHVDVGIEDETTREIPLTIAIKTKLSLEIEGNPFLHSAFYETITTGGRKSDRIPMFETQLKTIGIIRQISLHAVVKRDEKRSLIEYQFVDIRPDLRKYIEEIADERKTSEQS